MHFDARAAKLLQPGEHMVIDGCPGLRLVATASRKSWIYRYKAVADGRMKQTAIGQWPAISVQGAAAEWQKLRDGRAAGADPVSERRAARAKASEVAAPVAAVYTVGDVVKDYIDGHLWVNRQEAGALAAERMLKAMLVAEPAFAARAADSVARGDAFAIIEGRKDTPTAAAKLRSLLGSAWELALDAGKLDGNVPNWWRVVMKGRLKSKGKKVLGEHVGQSRRVLPASEVATLLAWLPNMHLLGQDTTLMYLWTCTRGVEFLAMRPEHIDATGKVWWWTVPKSETKNARHQEAVDLRVPLFGRAREVVKRRLKAVGKSGLLFEDARGEQYEQKDYSTYIYNLQPYAPKVTGRLGDGLVLPVSGWTPHNLRRTARTLLAALGCPNEIGEAIIGHMPPDIVGVYNAYTYDAERVLWLKRLSVYLERLASGDTSAPLPARP